MTHETATHRLELQEGIEHIRSACNECGVCQKQCEFLRRYGLPNQIAATFDADHPDHLSMAYECSLCGLCGAVCPQHLDLSSIFLTARRLAVATHQVDLRKYGTLLRYEKRGTSALFSYYGLPAGCDTIFFPGCTLPGTRPNTTRQIFEYLQRVVPTIGIVLDCCAKPSHDLGRQQAAVAAFSEMTGFLRENGVGRVIVACPNCHSMFRRYGQALAVETIYETIADHGLPPGATAAGSLTVHDPCPLRKEDGVHEAVRRILRRMGLSIQEMKHRRKRTLCCGEGGSVGFITPELARAWGETRRRESNGQKLVTYCAGCTGYLDPVAPSVHIADLIFDPEGSMNGGPKVSSSPMTYLNRLMLKQRFKKDLKPAVQRVRPPIRRRS